MMKNSENNGTGEIGLVTPTPGRPPGIHGVFVHTCPPAQTSFRGISFSRMEISHPVV